MLYADAGIYHARVEGDAGLFAPGQAAAGAQSRELPRLLRPRRFAGRLARTAGDAVGADHQRHPLLPRTASFRASRAPMCCRRCWNWRAAAGGCGCGRRPARAGQEPYSMALTVLSLEPDAAALDVRDSRQRHRPARRRGGAARSLPGRCARRGARRPAQALFHRRRRRRAARPAGERRAAPPGRLPHAQSHRRLADARAVPRDLLPQRRDLFRRADAADGMEQVRRRARARTASLYIGHSERVTGPAAARFVSDGVTTYRLRDGAGA